MSALRWGELTKRGSCKAVIVTSQMVTRVYSFLAHSIIQQIHLEQHSENGNNACRPIWPD